MSLSPVIKDALVVAGTAGACKYYRTRKINKGLVLNALAGGAGSYLSNSWAVTEVSKFSTGNVIVDDAFNTASLSVGIMAVYNLAMSRAITKDLACLAVSSAVGEGINSQMN